MPNIRPFVWKHLKAILTLLMFLVAGVGYMARDEITSIVREKFIYGQVKLESEDPDINKYAIVEVLDPAGKSLCRNRFQSQKPIELPPGTYSIRILYPRANGELEPIVDKPIKLSRFGRMSIDVGNPLPNSISIKLDCPKKVYLTGELIHFNIGVDRDGYVWVFAPDATGRPNQIFPNDVCPGNRMDAGKRYVIPPSFCPSFALKTRDTPGQEVVVAIVTQKNDSVFALSKLKKVVPHLQTKLDVSHESPWGYDKLVLSIKRPRRD